jgi:putative peptide zinc metalloprotease protein
MTSLFSRNWYRVEQLKPRLKPQVEISQQLLRGEQKYALRDPISGTIQLFSLQAYTVIGLMDGERDLNQIWLLAGDILKDELPTQEDVVSLMASLYQTDMLYLDVPVNAADLFERSDQKQSKKALQKVYSPLSVQIPLFDPTRLLDKIYPWIDRCVGWPLKWIYVLVVGYGLIVTAQNFDALTSNAADRVLAADNLFLLWILYPLIKIVHELGHAYTVRRYGGQVHEVGVMFLVFFPMPYVNASESAAFSDKSQRMMVAAAGLVVELMIAAIAVILWAMAADGLVKSILYNVAFMAGVSTLLFNGNPLLKFDAYYVLADYLEIPSLAKRGVTYWGYLFKKYIFRFREIEDPSVDAREGYWLFFYNLFSFMYRLFISISIVMFIGSKYFIVGVVLGIWTLVSSWVIPFVKTVSLPFRDSQFVMQGKKPSLVVGLLAVLLWALLFQMPLPRSITSSGVAWVLDHERLYANESGFVHSLSLPSDRQVVNGQLLVSLTNQELLDRAAVVDAQLLEAKSRLRSVYQDRTKSSLAAAELQRFQDERDDISEALAALDIRSNSDGRLVISQADTLQDRFVQRGEVIGYVIPPLRPLRIRVVVAELDAEQVITGAESINVKPASDRALSWSATLAAVVPTVSKEIPNAALTTTGGGDIVADPASDKKLLAMENYVSLELDASVPNTQYIFERFYVRFSLPPEPIAYRLIRQVRQVFIEQFEV